MKELFFKKRIPEPKLMDQIDFQSFSNFSQDRYVTWFTPLVDSIMEAYGFKEGRVLDLACGPGFLGKELAMRSKNFDIVCLDSSEHAIALAKKNCAGFENIHFAVGMVEKLPFEDATFDLIVCKDSFHHFKSAEKALKEILRVLKNGGILYIQDLRRDLPNYFIDRTLPLDNPMKKLQYYSVRASYTKEELTSLLKKFTFSKAKVFTRKVDAFAKEKYEKMGINPQHLKDSFQSRYILVLKK